MTTTCPHCQAEIEIDLATLASLQGQENFACPLCGGPIPVPKMPAGPVKVSAAAAIRPSQVSAMPSAATLASAHRGLNRNFLILGSVVLLVLGGIGIFLASQKSGDKTVIDTKEMPDLFLGDLTPISSNVPWRYRVNQYFSESPHNLNLLLVDGKDCDRYMLTHTPSIVEFEIPQGYGQFKAIGFAPFNTVDNKPLPSDWIYLVEVDGELVYSSKELRTYPNHQVAISVKFPAGAKKIVLRTFSFGGNLWGHSLWGYPMLTD
jgi:hypothetical protein